jgi:hypothetical protein
MQQPEEQITVTIKKGVIGPDRDLFVGDVVALPKSFALELIHSQRAVEGRVAVKTKQPATTGKAQQSATVTDGDPNPGNADPQSKQSDKK